MSRAHVIEIRLDNIHQLFNSMDPSPFHERDLDHDAEEFIVSWAQEYPVNEPLRLVIHLRHPPEGFTPEDVESSQGGRMDEAVPGGWRGILAEVLLIAGWVAMWKPVDTVLYRWWPALRLGRIHRKLASVPVKLHVEPPRGASGVSAAASEI